MNVLYFLENRLLATLPAKPGANSFLFVCPQCGETWASILIPGREFFPLRGACRQHSWGMSVPGSVADTLPTEHCGPMDYHRNISHLPPEVLAHELQVHLDYYNKELV